MNDILRERLIRKLDTLPEEKIYQILDYIDFLESKYAPKLSTAPNPLKRFAEGVEDTLRAGRMSAGVIGGTMSVMNKAVGVVTDVANAGKSVATEIAGVVSSVTSSKPSQTPQAGPAGPAATTTPPASPSVQTPPPPPPGDQRK
ncbi:MAG TPA: DUF2281 domain-containing protein [Gemmatimonadaceae bacterium]|jgi:hypothetical protein|nr:DUF2281 domain-containing protein [Gemmatimonadaceae bacterium]